MPFLKWGKILGLSWWCKLKSLNRSFAYKGTSLKHRKLFAKYIFRFRGFRNISLFSIIHTRFSDYIKYDAHSNSRSKYSFSLFIMIQVLQQSASVRTSKLLLNLFAVVDISVWRTDATHYKLITLSNIFITAMQWKY